MATSEIIATLVTAYSKIADPTTSTYALSLPYQHLTPYNPAGYLVSPAIAGTVRKGGILGIVERGISITGGVKI